MCLFSGYKMYFTLTRHTFGHLQSQLFPVYFTVGSCLSTVALATYYLMHPVQMWNENEKIQVNKETVCIIYWSRFRKLSAIIESNNLFARHQQNAVFSVSLKIILSHHHKAYFFQIIIFLIYNCSGETTVLRLFNLMRAAGMAQC